MSATYATDVALGFFVEVVDARDRRREYDQLQPGYTGLDGSLDFLAEHGSFARDAIDSARCLLHDSGSDVIRCEPELTPATVICNMKEWTPPEPPMLEAQTGTSSK